MVTIGADPEVFVMPRGADYPLPICGLVGGTKESPIQLGGGFAVQEDNVMLEYNVPPTGSPTLFAQYILSGWALARDSVRGVMISRTPYEHASAVFTAESLRPHPEAFMFGCSPDYDAYARGEQAPIVSPQSLYIQEGDGHRRMAGGHIHIGFDNPNRIPLWVVARLCDYFIYVECLNRMGCPSQGERGTMYGSPGRYRPTKYGIEYRTPSNWWVVRGIAVGSTELAHRVGLAAIKVGSMVEQVDPHVIKEFLDGVNWGSVRQRVRFGGADNEARERETACLPLYSSARSIWEGQ